MGQQLLGQGFDWRIHRPKWPYKGPLEASGFEAA
jgi:hypothetical protein